MMKPTLGAKAHDPAPLYLTRSGGRQRGNSLQVRIHPAEYQTVCRLSSLTGMSIANMIGILVNYAVAHVQLLDDLDDLDDGEEE